MLKNFRTYETAVEFYQSTVALKLPRHLKDQLQRAAASSVLNIAEGSAKSSPLDQARFFEISFASTKECQAILELAQLQDQASAQLADKLAAHQYRLIQSCRRRC